MNPQAPQMRGLSRDQEIKASDLYRDIRTPLQKIGDAFADSLVPAFVVSLLLLPVAFISTTFFISVCVPIIYWATGHAFGKDQKLPMLLPKEAEVIDFNDPKPGRHSYHKSRGEFLLGNLRGGKKKFELWLSFDHLLTHTLILGSTGSGKSEALLSIVSNYLSVGSGFLYSDAKASAKLGWQLFALCRYFGREDDFRALNYIKGNTSSRPDRAVRRGNTVNLFAYGSAESITQILVSLIPPGGSENKLFSERAISLISAIMPALVDLRDTAGLKINPGIIRKALEFEEIERLKRAKPISPESREALRAYLTSLSGYKESPKDRNGNPTDKQEAEVGRQHGFAQAYFTRALATLSDTYADIYMVGTGEISFLDLVLRRRACGVLIPALEKAPDEMKNLGKIVLAAQKNAISTGLPPDIEGRREDVLESLPTTAPIPFGIIIDEAAFQLTPGVATIAAQARSLGIGMIFASQDYAGIKREDPDEAEQIAENTKLKMVMQSEGLGATRELIQEIAGEGTAALASSYAMDEGSLSHMYRDSKSANFERRSRVDTQDTRASVEGEGIVFWRDNIIPINTYHHGLDEKNITKDFYIHRLLEVSPPTRGFGATLYHKDSLMMTSMRKAIHDGLDLGVDNFDGLPNLSDAPDNPLHSSGFSEALRLWRKLTPVMDHCQNTWPSKFKAVVSEGLLIQSLVQSSSNSAINQDEDYTDPDESWQRLQPKTSNPTVEASPEETTNKTLNENDIPRIDSASLDDPDAIMNLLRETSSTLVKSKVMAIPDTEQPEQESHTVNPKGLETPEIKAGSPDPKSSHHSGIIGTSGSPLVDSAPWLLDPNQLSNRAGRPLHQGEVDLALYASNAVNRLEKALGASDGDAEKVSWETAHSVTRAMMYPMSEEHTPATPETEAERSIVMRDSARTVSKMRSWLGDHS